MGMGDVLRRSALTFPDKTALVFGDQRTTYAELNERVNRLADSLLGKGLQKGDRVAALLHNCPEFIELYFACAKSGGIFVPINNLLRRKELTEILTYVEPRFLIFDDDFRDLVHSILPEVNGIEFPIAFPGDPGSPVRYENLVDRGKATEPDVVVSDDDIVSIFLTSGTTGRAKGAMRTHRHDFINILSCTIELGLTHEDRALLLFPFYHVMFPDHLRHILMSNVMVIRREGSFEPREVLDTLSTERITVCQFVPTMINALLQVDGLEAYDLSSFRLLLYAGSPMPVELLKKALHGFQCHFFQLYGQTETGPCTTALRPEDHILVGTAAQTARLASAGRAVVDYEVRIVNESGTDVEVGEIGEIIVRSQAMTVGYWDLPEETARTVRNGWLYTGDFGTFDKDRYLFIVDRKHDMIISGGKNIYPREIEEIIYSHEAVLEAAVIGVPDDYWGESVKAFVVLKEGMTATEEDIINLCKESIASYKKPRSVEFVDDLPKNPTGKILKRVIRDRYWKGRERNV